VEWQEQQDRRTRGRIGRVAFWLLAVAIAVPLGLMAFSPGLIGLRASDRNPTPEPLSGTAADAQSAAEAPLARAEELEPPAHPALEPAPFEAVEVSALQPNQGPGADPAAEAASPALDCIIEPHQVIAVRSPVAGRIETLRVERSDLVEAGQVLVELESGPEKSAVELARARATLTGRIEAREANLELGQRRRERAERLFANNALSLDLREEVETETTLARLELRQARDDQRLASLELKQAMAILKQRTIRSPIDGVVTERLMSPGEVVDEETVLKIAQIDPLRVEVILPSAWFGSIRAGTKAAVVPEVPGDRVYVASVGIVDRTIDAASGTFGVRLELPNPDHAIPSGLNCQVRFLDE
jgi:RND family efflux transporter MFP subunit